MKLWADAVCVVGSCAVVCGLMSIGWTGCWKQEVRRAAAARRTIPNYYDGALPSDSRVTSPLCAVDIYNSGTERDDLVVAYVHGG